MEGTIQYDQPSQKKKKKNIINESKWKKKSWKEHKIFLRKYSV